MQQKIKWYMISTISNKEKHVVDAIKNHKDSNSEDIMIKDVLVAGVPYLTPSKKYRKRNMFPGYIFVKMAMTNEAWFIIRNTQYVTGLIGSSGRRTKPTPVSDLEIAKIRQRIVKKNQQFEDTGRANHPKFIVDKTIVEVINGPKKSAKGKVLKVNYADNTILIELKWFDKPTPTEISLNDVKVIE